MMYPKPKFKKHRTEKVTEQTYYSVFNRDNGTCQMCGNRNNLELHHIYGRGKNLTNNINNCIMLCQHCHHNVVHNNNKKYRPILKEIVRKKGEQQ
jgi:5-methylcytosine-specific restriction endonuclease McrA